MKSWNLIFFFNFQVIEVSLAQLWFSNKLLERGKKLSDYIGKNEKTKVVLKITKSGSGPPLREPLINDEEKKLMMLHSYRRQEELKVSDLNSCFKSFLLNREINSMHSIVVFRVITWGVIFIVTHEYFSGVVLWLLVVHWIETKLKFISRTYIICFYFYTVDIWMSKTLQRIFYWYIQMNNPVQKKKNRVHISMILTFWYRWKENFQL